MDKDLLEPSAITFQVEDRLQATLLNLPDSETIALISSNQQLTYRELNQQANQLAHYLQALGVKPETLVGIYMNRSVDLIVGILAILKVGAAYVPLDPGYPRERLSFILEDTRAQIVITHSSLISELPTNLTHVICVDTSWEVLAQQNTENPENLPLPENLAYVMYTSGSTAKPKGVAMSHGSIAHYIKSLNQTLKIQASDTYLHTASFSFSSSVRQLMLPLTQGSKIVLASKEQTQNPLSLLELIEQQQVTVFDTVQSVWRYVLKQLKELEPASAQALVPSSLRKVIFSGGLLPCLLYQEVRQLLGTEVNIFNVYGQTETIGTSVFPIPATFDKRDGYVPVGHPLAHVQVLVLDEELQPVAADQKGELCIISPGLARGYFNLAELTAKRFIDYSLPDRTLVRLYRSGDVARFLSDGMIELLGRTDYQVKIREMRVELEEIEAVLEQHPLVRQAVVTAIDDANDGKRLVAYIVTNQSDSQQVELNHVLREFLKTKLPEYMLPSVILKLEKLPLTPNGKIDRKALPTNLELVQQDLAVGYLPPRNDVERELAEIWQKVLGVPQVGIQDDFFELGGNSFTAVSIFGQIESKFGKQLPLGSLFERSTIESLAEVIQETTSQLETNNNPGSSTKQIVKIQEGDPGKTPLFLVHALGMSVLYYRDFARYLGSDRPVYAIQPLEVEDQSTVDNLEALASLYIKEIQTIQPQGPYLLGGHSFGGKVAFEIAQQLQQQGQDIAFLALFDTYGPNAMIRLPLHKRILIHLNNLYSQGPMYLIERLGSWYGWIGGLAKTEYERWTFSKAQKQSESMSFEILKRGIEDFHSDLQNRYTYRPYSGDIHLFRCTEHETLNYYGVELDKEKLGWDKVATGGLTIYDALGKHLTMFDEPYVKPLAENVKSCLDRIRKSASLPEKGNLLK
ncbi:non-ribosomal peptide synthetase [Floridanema aerugineum]|uniref:Amino acid adenylation domain-containing protein n=1 Tax=Floridaenema aerugineum BLCC-F46 TaxID=3153654 RepID=A0ABV4X4A2_9CYAN